MPSSKKSQTFSSVVSRGAGLSGNPELFILGEDGDAGDEEEEEEDCAEEGVVA